ncbi:nucleotide-diphospho-sugar transferases [Trichococcus palustris]|uniref:Nucleotide-diphospho-sugar transferases n=1 Tax=Trichococcus palustris TaxID=140314 RepID=A0A143YRR4_9LACT|nr:glycosyltransferase family 2 protein [Trichococcus palustris]CZQ96528.1 nucleotide-diphospho-sugar transferases [Trichococcus palustris]SFK73809.1 Glycosyl transferase family 2 [Trichococcus palustris]
MDKISVIIPVYNVEEYLSECVNSVFNQTYSNLEIILVDDGSPDNCGKICDEYAKKDTRIKVVHKKNGGLGYARNTGLNIATGDYVMFLDSDDKLDTNAIKDLYDSLNKHQADISRGNFVKWFPKERKMVHEDMIKKEQSFVGEEKNIFLSKFICGKAADSKDYEIRVGATANLYSLALLNQYGIRFESEREYLSEDIIFNLYAYYHAKKIVQVPIGLYYYRHNDNSLTTIYKDSQLDGACNLYHKVRSIEEELGIKDVEWRVERLFLSKIRQVSQLFVFSDNTLDQKSEFMRSIVNNEDVVRILNCYPIKKMPIHQGISALLMKRKWAVLVIIYLKLYTILRKSIF